MSMETKPTPETVAAWTNEAETTFENNPDRVLYLGLSSFVEGYLAARHAAFSEYSKQLEEKDREIARLKRKLNERFDRLLNP